MSALTLDRAAELRAMIAGMEAAARTFYQMAQRVGHHQFLEFTGLLNEYVNLCTQSLERGEDFGNRDLNAGFHARYVAEKLGCIYGQTMMEHLQGKGATNEH